MGQRKTLGGDRLGAGKKQKVDTTTFNRSSHDLGYVWRSTMSAGTLVPFMAEVALPGDSFDINLGCEVLTLPTVGPLFGHMKVQLDVFTAPVRLYQGQLHNNKLGIGLNMASVKLPIAEFDVPYKTPAELALITDVDNMQINPSCILAYLGMRGLGIANQNTLATTRKFNAIPLLAYWDIFKNYYANKQEENAFVIHTGPPTVPNNITEFQLPNPGGVVPEFPAVGGIPIGDGGVASISTTATQPPNTIMVGLQLSGTDLEWVAFNVAFNVTFSSSTSIIGIWNYSTMGERTIMAWRYLNGSDAGTGVEISLTSFALADIDVMRESILQHASAAAFRIFTDSGFIAPYSLLTASDGQFRSLVESQEGLAVKTYQSDLFNNWLNTEYIDGVNGIAAVTAVSTTGDEFTIDSLILHKKVYEMLNDVLVSGGTYDDWQEVVYDHVGITRAETPIYWGSLIKELQFQEVVSNSESQGGSGVQPLGTLAGRGRLGQKHKGGNINVKVDEISYLMGIVSITPRIDYSQGNEWHMSLETMDDFHKPHLDEIGFQELITEQMAWWETEIDALGNLVTRSAGKQPAWINYMTNVNRVRGNFAMKDNSMFMVLTRRYEPEQTGDGFQIADLTTYINPTHFNHIFAQTSLDSQNYWVQIGVDMIGRRKISARVMPNL